LQNCLGLGELPPIYFKSFLHEKNAVAAQALEWFNREFGIYVDKERILSARQAFDSFFYQLRVLMRAN
jgi:hypothetical protein